MSTTEMLQKIDEVLQKSPENRHSYYQLKYFVLGKEPTTQAQMWQCLKELKSRRDTIDTLIFETENLADYIELLEIQQENFTADTKENTIKTRKLKRHKEQLEKNMVKLTEKLKFVKQEAQFFMDAFESLQKIEPLKDYDDFEAQKEYWEMKISEEINLKILLKQPLSSDLVKTAIVLHEGSEIKNNVIGMLSEAHNRLTHKKDVDDK
jgi:hypothetical protein